MPEPDIGPKHEGVLFLTGGMPPVGFVTKEDPAVLISQIKNNRQDGIFELHAITDAGIDVHMMFRDEHVAGISLRKKSALNTK